MTAATSPTEQRAASPAATMGEPWRVEMFGGLRLVRGDRIVTRFRTQKTAALLAYLAYHADRTHSRELLAERFWPDATPDSARHSLRLALSDLRRLLEPPDCPVTILIAGRTMVELLPGAVTTDAAWFDRALDRLPRTTDPTERRRLLETAVDLYRGPFLPGMYEDWVTPQQIRREEQYADAVHALIASLEKEDDRVVALRYARQAALLLPQDDTILDAVARLQIAAPPTRPEPASHTPPSRASAPRPPLLAAGTITVLSVEETGELGRMNAERIGRQRGGHTLQVSSDVCVLAFGRARDALAALNDCWATGRLHRAALHTGEAMPHKESEGVPDRPHLTDSDPVILTEILRRSAGPGLVVCTETTAHLLRPVLTDTGCLVSLGLYRLLPDAAPERVYRLVAPEESPVADDGPLLNAPRADLPNLPLTLTRFFGRQNELIGLKEVLTEGEYRLLTLTGPGGSGKTRLALEMLGRQSDPCAARSGIRAFVPLADITDAARIPDAVRRVLNLPPPVPGLDPRAPIADALNRHPCALLVLDNAEHLLSDSGSGEDAAAFVADLLERVPTLTCLVTSRRPLGIPGEREIPVAPLPTEEAVALFADRAQAARPDFALTEANTPMVHELCQRLDSLPLAVELAAARAGTLSPAQMLNQIAARLDPPGRLGLLARRGPSSGSSPRHRSVRAAIQWSYDLLPPEQQAAFSRLSVFRGGWTVEAASAVLCQPPPTTLDLLDDLRRHSLILVEESADGSGEMRYRMLETLLAFGEEQLSPEERQETARRHVRYFADFAEMARRKQHDGPSYPRSEREWLWKALEAERENCRTALAFCRDGDAADRETGLHMAVELAPDWYYRGELVETAGWLSSLLDAAIAAGAVSEFLRGVALFSIGYVSRMIGRGTKARQRLQEAAEVLRAFPESEFHGWSLCNLGISSIDHGEYEEAERLNREAFAVFRQHDDENGMGQALSNLGLLRYRRGEIREAAGFVEEAMQHFRRGDHPVYLAIGLNMLCCVRNDRCEHDSATAAGTESLHLFRSLNCRHFIGMAARDLGFAFVDKGDADAALPCFEEAMQAFTESGAEYGVLTTRMGLMTVYLMRDAPGDAGAIDRHFAAVEAVKSRYHNMIPRLPLLRGVQAILRHGDPEKGIPLLREALAGMLGMDERGSVAICLEWLAAGHFQRGCPERAAHLLGAADSLRETHGLCLSASERERFSELRTALGEIIPVPDWRAVVAEEISRNEDAPPT